MFSNVMHQRRQQAKVDRQKENSKSPTTYTGKADIGGPWSLIDTKGNKVTHEDFTDRYYLIYFGFTYCPDVCPISLQKMAKALNNV